MSGKRDIDETQPDARLNAGCLLAPTLSLAVLLFLSIVVFNATYRSAFFAINVYPFYIGALYLALVAPFVALSAVIEIRSPIATQRRKSAARCLLCGLTASVIFLVSAWLFVLRR